MSTSAPPKKKNPWGRYSNIQVSLEQSLVKDFDRVVTAYSQSDDKSYSTFCQLAQKHGVTLAFHWCAPNTPKKPCLTREYCDKVIYLILQTAKTFWLCQSNPNENCPHHPGNAEQRFWKQVGGLFLVHILYGNQPSIPGRYVQIDLGIRDVSALERFESTASEMMGNTEHDGGKKIYQGIQYICTLFRAQGAFRPTVLEFELGQDLLNFKT